MARTGRQERTGWRGWEVPRIGGEGWRSGMEVTVVRRGGEEMEM